MQWWWCAITGGTGLIAGIVGASSLILSRRRKPHATDSEVSQVYRAMIRAEGAPEPALQLKEIVQKSTETIEGFLALAILYQKQGDLRQAVALFRSVYIRSDAEPLQKMDAVRGYLECLCALGETALAAEESKQFFYLFNNRPTVLRAILRCYIADARWKDADAMLHRIQKLEKQADGALAGSYQLAYGRWLKTQQKEKKAIAAFQKAAELLPGDPEPNFELFNLYYERDASDKALTALANTLNSITPADQARVESLIYRLAKDRISIKVEDLLIEKLNHVADHNWMRVLLIETLMMRGQLTQAKDILVQEAWQGFVSDTLKNRILRCAIMLGEPAKVLQQLNIPLVME